MSPSCFPPFRPSHFRPEISGKFEVEPVWGQVPPQKSEQKLLSEPFPCSKTPFGPASRLRKISFPPDHSVRKHLLCWFLKGSTEFVCLGDLTFDVFRELQKGTSSTSSSRSANCTAQLMEPCTPTIMPIASGFPSLKKRTIPCKRKHGWRHVKGSR